MARSSYIYVVSDGGLNMIAAFTVRHELTAWFNRHGQPGFQVWRLRDNPRAHDEPVFIDMKNA